MSAEIISLEAWRRRHCAHHEPQQNAALRIPFLVPTWPCGWLQPMLVEIDMSNIAEFGALAACASQTRFGEFLYRDRARRADRNQGKSATVHQLFQAPTARAKAARSS
jgi:hypothetical protein